MFFSQSKLIIALMMAWLVFISLAIVKWYITILIIIHHTDAAYLMYYYWSSGLCLPIMIPRLPLCLLIILVVVRFVDCNIIVFIIIHNKKG